MKGFHECTELMTGANHYVVPKEEPITPPEGFVDTTVNVFRLNPDGTKGELMRTMEAFPPGWSDRGFKKKGKEDEEMARPRREPPPVETLRALYEKYDAKIQPIAIELDATWMMARRWLREAGIIDQKQTPTPEPTQAANQEPEREEAESAGTSLTQEKPEFTVKDVLQYELAQREQGFGPEDDESIPYVVAGEDLTLDELKIAWIDLTLGAALDPADKVLIIEKLAGIAI